MVEPNIFIAFLAGIVAFLSPCIFPVIPSYIAYMGAASYQNGLKREKGGLFLILSFVLGFTIVFTIMGVLLSVLGFAFREYSVIISRVSGVVVILLGLNTIFNFLKFLDYEKKVEFRSDKKGVLSSLLLGMAFGAGWSPCIGPILASILFLAGNSSTLFSGTVLLLFFSIGLGIPFIFTGIFITKYGDKSKSIKKHMGKIKIFSGILITFIGVFIFFDRMSQINVVLFKWADSFSRWYSVNGAIFNKILAGFNLVIALIIAKKRSKASYIISTIFFILTVVSYTGLVDWGNIVSKYLTFQGL